MHGPLRRQVDTGFAAAAWRARLTRISHQSTSPSSQILAVALRWTVQGTQHGSPPSQKKWPMGQWRNFASAHARQVMADKLSGTGVIMLWVSALTVSGIRSRGRWRLTAVARCWSLSVLRWSS